MKRMTLVTATIALVAIAWAAPKSERTTSLKVVTEGAERASILQEPKRDVPSDELVCPYNYVKVCHEECDPRATPPPGTPCQRIQMCHCEQRDGSH